MWDISQKTVLITGANSGIGKAAALELAKKGSHVVMLCRNPVKAQKAREEIIQKSGNSNVDIVIIDLASMQSIRSAAEKIKQSYSGIDVLINNAGVIDVQKYYTIDGLEKTFGTNHVGPFLLTTLLLDHIKSNSPARIINVSSNGHKRAKWDFDNLQGEKQYRLMSAYFISKLANIYFTDELAEMLIEDQVTVNAVHPGLVATNFSTNLGNWWLRPFARIVMLSLKLFARTPRKGAETIVYLAESEEVNDVTGEYFFDKRIARKYHQKNAVERRKRLWKLSEKLTQ